MKLLNGLMLVLVIQGFFVNNGFALTLVECSQTGGNCVCIAFPGSDTVCTHSKDNSLMALKKEKEKWSFLHNRLARL